MAFGALLTYGTASAQTVYSIDEATLQPLVYRSANQIVGCGLRSMMFKLLTDTSATIVDFSITLRVEPKAIFGLGKAGVLIANPTQDAKLAKELAVTSFFLSTEDGQMSAAPAKFVPAENPSFVLGGFDSSIAIDLLDRLQSGERLQFGVQVKGESMMRVYSFNASISEDDRNSYIACTTGLVRTGEGYLNEQEAK